MIGAPHSLLGWAVMKIRIMLFDGFFGVFVENWIKIENPRQ